MRSSKVMSNCSYRQTYRAQCTKRAVSKGFARWRITEPLGFWTVDDGQSQRFRLYSLCSITGGVRVIGAWVWPCSIAEQCSNQAGYRSHIANLRGVSRKQRQGCHGGHRTSPASQQIMRCFTVSINKQNKQTPWSESANELHRPSNRCLSAKWLPTCADRGCHVVSVTDPYGRILGFLDRSGYFSFK
jgi:hypothetical protein